MDVNLKLLEANPEANSGHILVSSKENLATDTEIALRRDAAMDAARRYAHHSRTESIWRIFEAWPRSTVSLSALPAAPDTVAMFIGA